MSGPEEVVPDLNLQPGELYIARRPAILRTILGSCVGVTIWCKRLGAGALYHGVLPNAPQEWKESTPMAERMRYIDFAISHLAHEFDAMGARRRELEVKLFGGGDVLPTTENRLGRPTVGALNCVSATNALTAAGLRLAASDLGGVRGRRIHFHTGTGAVLLYRL